MNSKYDAQLQQENNKTKALEAELEQVGGQTIEDMHDTCEAEYKFLDKLENQLSKNKEFDKKKIDEIKREA